MPKRPDSPFRSRQPLGRQLRALGRVAKPSRPETVRAGLAVYQSPRWIKLSAQLRKEVGHCEQCGRSDGQLYVDHVIELQDGGDPWHRINLMVLCAHCHTTKTRAAARDRAWRPLAEQLEDQLRQAGHTDANDNEWRWCGPVPAVGGGRSGETVTTGHAILALTHRFIGCQCLTFWPGLASTLSIDRAVA